MKKSMRIAVAVMVVLMLCLSLASCGGKTLSGKYEMSGVTYEFVDNTVTVSYTPFLGNEVYTLEGEYKIKNDKITITFEDVEENRADDAKKYGGTFKLEESEEYIIIGNRQYDKVIED